MQQYNCIIIEDEPLAAEVLQEYISVVPFLNFKNHYSNAMSALNDIYNSQIDLIFLDINLPKLTGIEFLKSLKNPPHIIITTAYQEYALEGYELNIVDYLLKPFEFTRFLKAVNKLKFITSELIHKDTVQIPKGRDYLFVYVDKKRIKIPLNEIIYLESLKEYVRIVLPDKSIITKSQLGQMEENLDKDNFLRIHRSFIVSREKIDAYTSTSIELQGKTLPIGRSYKELIIGILSDN